MLVVHIRDLLLCFIGIIVDLRLFIRLIRLIHVAFPVFVLIPLIRSFILLIRPLALLVLVLVLLVTLLRLRWFVFLLVHVTHFLTVKNIVTNHSALKIMPAAPTLEGIANGEIEYHIADICSTF